MWTAAILAGGQARRLGGRDKAALRLGPQAIVERQIGVLRQVADVLLIVANDPARYRALGLPVVPDLVPGAGSLGGIYTAICAAPTERTLVVACDMPFLSVAFLQHLLAVGRDVDVAIPRDATGYQPLCATYARRAAEPIRRRIEAGILKVSDVLADLRVREIGADEIAPFDPAGALFFNINTPDDYARALDLIARP